MVDGQDQHCQPAYEEIQLRTSKCARILPGVSWKYLGVLNTFNEPFSHAFHQSEEPCLYPGNQHFASARAIHTDLKGEGCLGMGLVGGEGGGMGLRGG